MEDNQLKLYNYLKTFQDITIEDFEIIRSYLRTKSAVAGDILLEEGKKAKELYFIVSGILKITTRNEKGNEVVLFFVKENKLCTIIDSFTSDRPSAEAIVAATDMELLVFSKERLHLLYEKLPFFKSLIENLSQKALLDKIQQRNSYMGEIATTRYLKFITLQPDIIQKVPLSDIASFLGIAQQSLSRIRKNIKF
ncbi:Crp/Fnr family transcriptional regulator [Mucilaginibacter sp. 22184]|uniref:Crp/Fnr family transcriptional regulator n=1 Tax=Mucilaginibacter sp. 22184 TaxID=3453887 RepID=UPI003F8288EC